jgi:hypothetical protein
MNYKFADIKVDVTTFMLTDIIMKYHSGHNNHLLLPHRIVQHFVENLSFVLPYCETLLNHITDRCVNVIEPFLRSSWFHTSMPPR